MNSDDGWKNGSRGGAGGGGGVLFHCPSPGAIKLSGAFSNTGLMHAGRVYFQNLDLEPPRSTGWLLRH